MQGEKRRGTGKQRQLKLKGGIGGDTAACAQRQLKASARQA